MSMSKIIEAEYREGLRRLIQEEGRPVFISERERAEWPSTPELWVSTYGWEDDDAQRHVSKAPAGYHAPERFGNCGWVLPHSMLVEEVSYSEFQDTDTANKNTVGINAEGSEGEPITCLCGKYSGVTLRVETSLSAALHSILGLDRKAMAI